MDNDSKFKSAPLRISLDPGSFVEQPIGLLIDSVLGK